MPTYVVTAANEQPPIVYTVVADNRTQALEFFKSQLKKDYPELDSELLQITLDLHP